MTATGTAQSAGPNPVAVRAGGEHRHILFIQHAGALGGSAFSLLFTMQGLREQGYAPEVALIHPTDAMTALYRDHGFVVHAAPAVGIFAHTTGGYARLSSSTSWWQLWRQIRDWRRSKQATLDLVHRLKPDLVHLNSVVLLPSAQALREAKIPHVWHVRECPPKTGWRTRFIGRELLRHRQVVFISKHDQMRWAGGGHGVVIPNFVDFRAYERAPSQDEARRLLGLPEGAPVVLFFGGTTAIKGFSVLLEAIPTVLAGFPDALFAMPGAAIYPSSSMVARAARRWLPLVGWGTAGQRVMKRIAHLGIGEAVRLLPFAKDIVPWLAACDLLVFPSVAPHFARPVIEAGAMGRPVVGSEIGGVRELVEAGRTGLLVPPNDAEALGKAMVELLIDRGLARRMGDAGRERARLCYSMERNIAALSGQYQESF